MQHSVSLIVLLSLSSQSLAITFSDLIAPDSTGGINGTLAQGIDGTSIVGSYTDSSNHRHGFLFDGAWHTLDFPSATATVAYGIANGIIVGRYNDAGNNHHGFMYDGTTWTSLDAPLAFSNPSNGGFNGTQALAISGNTIVGYYGDAAGHAHGFIFDGSSWTTLNEPNAVRATIPTGISGNTIVGYYEDTGSSDYGFVFDGATWKTISDPLGVTGTIPTGVSGNNIVGWYGDAQGRSHGFLYNGSTFTTVDDPNAYSAIGTTLTAVDGSSVVGYYATGGQTQQYAGFRANVPEPSSLILAAIASAMLMVSRWQLPLFGPFRESLDD